MNKRVSTSVYVGSTVAFATVITLVYHLLFLEAIDLNIINIHFSKSMSRMIFSAIMLVGTVISGFVNYRSKTIRDIVANPLYPLGLYSLVSSLDTIVRGVIWFAVIFFGILLLITLIGKLFHIDRRLNLSSVFRNIKMKSRRFLRSGKKSWIRLAILASFIPIVFSGISHTIPAMAYDSGASNIVSDKCLEELRYDILATHDNDARMNILQERVC